MASGIEWNSLKNASLAGNGRVRKVGIEPFQLVEHVGLNMANNQSAKDDGCMMNTLGEPRYLKRGLDKRFTQPGESDDDELVFPGQIPPRNSLRTGEMRLG